MDKVMSRTVCEQLKKVDNRGRPKTVSSLLNFLRPLTSVVYTADPFDLLDAAVKLEGQPVKLTVSARVPLVADLSSDTCVRLWNLARQSAGGGGVTLLMCGTVQSVLATDARERITEQLKRHIDSLPLKRDVTEYICQLTMPNVITKEVQLDADNIIPLLNNLKEMGYISVGDDVTAESAVTYNFPSEFMLLVVQRLYDDYATRLKATFHMDDPSRARQGVWVKTLTCTNRQLDRLKQSLQRNPGMQARLNSVVVKLYRAAEPSDQAYIVNDSTSSSGSESEDDGYVGMDGINSLARQFIEMDLEVTDLNYLPKTMMLETVPMICALEKMGDSKPKTVGALLNSLRGSCRYRYFLPLDEVFKTKVQASENFNRLSRKRRFQPRRLTSSQKNKLKNTKVTVGSYNSLETFDLTPRSLMKPSTDVEQTLANIQREKEERRKKQDHFQVSHPNIPIPKKLTVQHCTDANVLNKRVYDKVLKFYSYRQKNIQNLAYRKKARVLPAMPEQRHAMFKRIQEKLQVISDVTAKDVYSAMDTDRENTHTKMKILQDLSALTIQHGNLSNTEMLHIIQSAGIITVKENNVLYHDDVINDILESTPAPDTAEELTRRYMECYYGEYKALNNDLRNKLHGSRAKKRRIF